MFYNALLLVLRNSHSMRCFFLEYYPSSPLVVGLEGPYMHQYCLMWKGFREIGSARDSSLSCETISTGPVDAIPQSRSLDCGQYLQLLPISRKVFH